MFDCFREVWDFELEQFEQREGDDDDGDEHEGEQFDCFFGHKGVEQLEDFLEHKDLFYSGFFHQDLDKHGIAFQHEGVVVYQGLI